MVTVLPAAARCQISLVLIGKIVSQPYRSRDQSIRSSRKIVPQRPLWKPLLANRLSSRPKVGELKGRRCGSRHLTSTASTEPTAQPAGMVERGRSGYRLSSGVEGARRKVPGGSHPRCRLWRDLAWSKKLERRSDPDTGCAADGNPPRLARRPRRYPQPVHGGGDRRHD